ncbi:MAG: hypothetical protein IID42_10270 [Planctomycetes bacterium]|nr:hypothetical protein [Planctomycetota bacterium]
MNTELVRNDCDNHSIHRVMDADSFTCVCRQAIYCDNELSVVAGNADVDALSHVITKVETDVTGKASVAHDAPRYLEIADWWCALCVVELAYTFFAARDGETTAAVADLAMANLGGPESIIGFF